MLPSQAASYLFLLVGLGGLGSLVLVAELIVALVQLLALLLEVLQVLVLLGQLLAEASNLTGLARGAELLALLLAAAVAFVGSEAIFEAHDVEDQEEGSVEDEGQEQCEAAEVHVALRVEFADLDFEAFVAHDGGAARGQLR